MIYNVIEQHISLVNFTHRLIAEKLTNGDIVIDATVGNGYDTEFLLELVKPNGQVFGFDIQQCALDTTNRRTVENKQDAGLTLFHSCHSELSVRIPESVHGQIKAVIFNLGYLPGGDKTIITKAQTTITALQQSCRIVSVGGFVSVLAYPGHPGGQCERDAIADWLAALSPADYLVNVYQNSPHSLIAPVLYGVEKIR